MTTLYMLTLGGWLWWWLLSVSDTRVTLGRGGPVMLMAGWLVAAALMLRAARKHAGKPVTPWREVLAGIATVLLAVSWAFDALDVGDGPDMVLRAGLLAAGGCGVLVLLLEAVVRPLMARFGLERAVDPCLDPPQVVRVMVPLLLPCAALLGMACAPATHGWPQRLTPVGATGILYVSLRPMLLPAAIVAGWALDGAMGRRRPTALAVAAASALIAWIPVSADVLWALQGRDELTTPTGRAVADLFTVIAPNGAREFHHWGWFMTSEGWPQDGTWRAVPLHLDSLFIGSGVLVALSVALVAAWAGAARRGLLPRWRGAAVLVGGAWLLAWCGAAVAGPAGAPWGASLAALLALGDWGRRAAQVLPVRSSVATPRPEAGRGTHRLGMSRHPA